MNTSFLPTFLTPKPARKLLGLIISASELTRFISLSSLVLYPFPNSQLQSAIILLLTQLPTVLAGSSLQD